MQSWWFPIPLNAQAQAYDTHFKLNLYLVAAIFLLAQGLLFYAIFRYRNRGQKAEQFEGSNKLEIGWTAATAVIFIGLALAGQQIWARMHLNEIPKGAMRVEVLAKQFTWSFRYPGPDGIFGRTSAKAIDDAGGNPFGIDPKDPAGKDDVVSGALRVPLHRDVELLLKSRDVIHNFFVRELRLKQDIVPGMTIPIHFRADQAGEYEIPCSELCGLGHHQMRSTLAVLTEKEFAAWLAQSR